MNQENQDVPISSNSEIKIEKETPDEPAVAVLSKNQQKKLKRQLEWDAKRDERKQWRKDKRKERAEKRRQQSASHEDDDADQALAHKPKRIAIEAQEPRNLSVVLDMAFDDLMTENEIISLTSQVSRCYSANRRSTGPIQLIGTSFGGASKKRFDTVLNGYKNWPTMHMTFSEQPYEQLFDKEKLVYLTADSPNILEHLEEEKVYVIGAIVDKNRYKGLCQKKAEEQGIQTAQLPIGQYMKLASRRILTVNHVFEILLEYLDNGRNWAQSLNSVIPSRKVAATVSEPDATENSK